MPQPSSLSPLRVLVVDDDTAATLLARLALEESALEADVLTAGGVLECRQLLAEAASRGADALPHLILLDLNLRDGSGHDLLHAIKHDPALREIPVVILSTSSDPYDVQRAMDAGARRYIVKPPDFNEFVDAMTALSELFGTEPSV